MITVHVRENRFAEIGAQLVAGVPTLIDSTVVALHDRIAQTAPVGATGKLHEDITDVPAHPTGNGQRGGIELEEYWHFVEYGTHRQPGQPFVTPAVELLRAPFFAGARRLLPIA